MNKLVIIGNVSNIPELRTTPNGKTVCNFNVAVNRRKKVEGQPDADFFRVSAWRQLGENCAKFLAKGRKVCVVGPVSVRTYTTKDGETKADKYLLGHIFISANRLYGQLKEHGVAEETIKSIVHIVLAHHGELEFGSPVKPCSQEAVIVNLLDNLSAKLDTIEYTGNMENSFALGTHVVK